MKLIVSDMDGTLLNQTWRISEENKQAILEAQKQGIEFVIATGRPYTNVTAILEEAGISCPVISLNGAETRDVEGNLLASQPLSKEQVRNVHNILLEEDMYFELMTSIGAFSLSEERCRAISRYIALRELPDLLEEEREKIVNMMFAERVRNENCKFVDSFEPLLEDNDIVILKIFALTTYEDRLVKADARLRKLDGLAITSSGHENLEVNNLNGHKGYAVLEYAKSKGIDASEIMAMGDSYNDLTMLTSVGRGVAMANASEHIRNQVAYTTKRNTESGVAHAIYEMLASRVQNV
ncbi:HAD family hydrolase [Paenibacillus endoradicis]|uniref:HAD family hydrolase n=1 Tax=Paenibacillus endoradicis TaxID=2972487 RepID=UPI002159A1C7|nr:HAD family hydrolase [Paenibacillus endoradicis]MCR8657583.1 HAD family hydrolase [Paenibacillus endoradicis]